MFPLPSILWMHHQGTRQVCPLLTCGVLIFLGDLDIFIFIHQLRVQSRQLFWSTGELHRGQTIWVCCISTRWDCNAQWHLRCLRPFMLPALYSDFHTHNYFLPPTEALEGFRPLYLISRPSHSLLYVQNILCLQVSWLQKYGLAPRDSIHMIPGIPYYIDYWL